MRISVPTLVLMAVLVVGYGTASADETNPAKSGTDLEESSSEWDEPPKFKRARGLPPLYPKSYVYGNKSGWATVTYTVGVEGKAKDVVLEAASDPKFGNHVAAAIKVWPHFPATRSGLPVEARITRKFSLEFE